jgi:putative two-component system response regulator
MTPLTSVLIVDDEAPIRELMARWVESLGLQPCTAATAEEAVETLSTRHCDLAIIDIMMPGKNGLWLASELRRDHPDVAVVLATGNEAMVRNAPPPIADLLIKPFKRDRFVLAVDRGREWRRQAVEELEWQAHLSLEVQARIADVQWEIERGHKAGHEEADVLWKLAAERMPDVVAHSERVVRYTVSIARELDLSSSQLANFERGARFHDIGKMAMPEAVLTKPSPLTPGEVAIMRGHVEAGVEILQAASTLMATVPIVRASHEWFSGKGYPQGLAGSEIPLASRIIAVADAYDAMTQDRAYRIHLESSDAVAEILRCTPAQFDPEIVAAFVAVLGRH